MKEGDDQNHAAEARKDPSRASRSRRKQEPEAAQARPRLSATVVALGFVSLLNDIGGDLVSPLLPAFVAAVGGGPEALGLIEGTADAATSLLQLASGYLADKFGRLKLITFAGYGIAAISRPALALTATSWQVLLVRLADRVGKGVRSAPRDALVAEATAVEARGRAYGFHRAMDNAGAALGPAAAYLMLRGGMPMRTAFAWTALPGAIALVALALGVREADTKRISNERSGTGLPESPVYRGVLLAVFIFSLGVSSDAFLLWRAGEIGVRTEFAPLLWMVLALVKSATSTWGGALSDRVGRRLPIVAGWAVYALCYLGFGFANSGWQVWLLFALYGTFFGLTEGAERALVVDLVDEQWRARALGAYHAAVGAAMLPASLLFGVVYQAAGAAAAFTMGAGLAALAIAILPRRLVREQASAGRA